MGKQCMAELGGKSHRSPSGEILGSDGADQADDAQSHHQQAHPENVGTVPVGDAHVNDGSHNQRNQQFKGCFQQLEQRPQHSFQLVAAQINQQFFHWISRYLLGVAVFLSS